MVERQARDLEVQVRVLVQVQIFPLKFNNLIIYFVYWIKLSWLASRYMVSSGLS